MTKTDRRREPIWPFVIPAVLIASIWSALSVYAAHDGLAGDGQSAPYMVGYFFGVASSASLIVWIVFYLLFFRARASVGKALGALATIFAFTFALQFVPIVALQAIQGDQRAAHEQMQLSVARLTTLGDQLTTDVGALDLATYENAGIVSQAHVTEWAGKLREATAHIERYDAALAAEAAANHALLAELNLSDAQRTALLTDMDEAIGPDSLLRRTNAARLRELAKSIELLDLLMVHPNAWRIENNAPAFYEQAQLDRFESMRREVLALRDERVRLERMLTQNSAVNRAE